jgi:hypothetical protein
VNNQENDELRARRPGREGVTVRAFAGSHEVINKGQVLSLIFRGEGVA